MVNFLLFSLLKVYMSNHLGVELLLRYYSLLKTTLDIPTLALPGGSEGKESACSAGDLGLSPGLGRSPGEGNGNPVQYSRLENSMDRGDWQATVHGVAKSRTQLSTNTHTQLTYI